MKKYLLLFLMAFMMCGVTSHAASIKVTGKLTSQTAYTLKLKKSSRITHWQIRVSDISDEESMVVKYKKVKTLKKSTKSYTVKKLKKNKDYTFEIVGMKKVKGKLKAKIYDYVFCFTGMTPALWDDYAYAAPCSPQSINLCIDCSMPGLPISGFEIQRKEEGAETFALLKKVGAKVKVGTLYEDTSVEGGKTYVYRFRSYGTYNKKKKYSPWSDELTLSAVNPTGTFHSEIISRTSDEMVVKLTSDEYNAALDFTEYAQAWSNDGVEWNTGELIIAGGTSVYVRMDPSVETIDADAVTYNHMPCFFSLVIGGDGQAWPNAEYIH